MFFMFNVRYSNTGDSWTVKQYYIPICYDQLFPGKSHVCSQLSVVNGLKYNSTQVPQCCCYGEHGEQPEAQNQAVAYSKRFVVSIRNKKQHHSCCIYGKLAVQEHHFKPGD